MRLVLDTNVVASALLWAGAPWRLLLAARTSPVRLFTSAPLLAELGGILGRPKFDRKLAASGLSVAQHLERYAALATEVAPILVTGIAPDPDDDVVIGTALAAHADAIITGDRGLLSVVEYRGIAIGTVGDALARIQTGR
ncbi:MAG: putative toxin-antitoxin system toxin component, PIN family [Xanthomonadales bacterium]|nr:putative toxin-antitoxin system toxin component, PIN family [Xanthomonadales bacterium]